MSPHLRRKFDSVDVVQSVWADLLPRFRAAAWQFENSLQLRGFLIKATRHRLIDRIRKHRPGLELERPLVGSARKACLPRASRGPAN